VVPGRGDLRVVPREPRPEAGDRPFRPGSTWPRFG
jgi:hypothetical protein